MVSFAMEIDQTDYVKNPSQTQILSMKFATPTWSSPWDCSAGRFPENPFKCSVVQSCTPWKLTYLPKIDGWKMTFPFDMVPFQGASEFFLGVFLDVEVLVYENRFEQNELLKDEWHHTCTTKQHNPKCPLSQRVNRCMYKKLQSLRTVDGPMYSFLMVNVTMFLYNCRISSK